MSPIAPRPRRRGPSPGQVARRALRIALRRRCPACGEGKIWTGWLTLAPSCPVCGVVPHRGEADFFTGAALVNFIVAELVVALTIAVVLVATLPDTPWTALLYGGIALAIVAPVVAYPFTTTFWLAVDMIFRPVGHEE